ncbi:hypothetical protein DFH06DRAFT_1141160 [Mycena polygramma]|nr:hypothetical protein DFH06DRAFT_1141160 [Mycena polygramma]
MDNFNEIHAALSSVPGLCESIGMEKAMVFVRLASRLKDSILAAQPPSHPADTAPTASEIPEAIRTFLGGAVELPDEYIDGCRKAFGNFIWLKAARMLYPPTHYCTTPNCIITSLLRDKDGPSKAVLYTLSDGACPTFATHLTCAHCRAPYYPNYVVRDGVLIYHDRIPNEIQVGEHQYIERTVLNLFLNLMLISWTSATNGARVYHESLSQPNHFPDHPDWMDTSFKLRPEHVWDGVILLALLEDHEARSATLRVPHTGDQKDRLNNAMEECNARIQLCGQPEWGYYCTRCLRVWEDDDGKMITWENFMFSSWMA